MKKSRPSKIRNKTACFGWYGRAVSIWFDRPKEKLHQLVSGPNPSALHESCNAETGFKRPVGRHFFFTFLAGLQKAQTSSTPIMGKQSQKSYFSGGLWTARFRALRCLRLPKAPRDAIVRMYFERRAKVKRRSTVAQMYPWLVVYT